MPALLVLYFIVALTYAALCGILGKAYHPLIAYLICALALTPGLALALIGGRILGLWEWRRLWPPTPPETKAALASVLILTVSTLMYLSPQSMIAILIAQAGCLCLPVIIRQKETGGSVARRDNLLSFVLVALSIGAVILSILHKPLTVAFLPVVYGLLKTLGYWFKISACDKGKAKRSAQDTADFLAAEQVLVSLSALAVAAVFAIAAMQSGVGHGGKAFAFDWRLWTIGFTSLGMGLLGTRIMLDVKPTSLTFPAYKMVGLLAALGASVARGELTLRADCWPGWTAASLACVVIWLSRPGAATK